MSPTAADVETSLQVKNKIKGCVMFHKRVAIRPGVEVPLVVGHVGRDGGGDVATLGQVGADRRGVIQGQVSPAPIRQGGTAHGSRLGLDEEGTN